MTISDETAYGEWPDRAAGYAGVGERAHVHEVEVTDADAATHAIDGVVAEHGGIDVPVDNAGYGSMVEAARTPDGAALMTLCR